MTKQTKDEILNLLSQSFLSEFDVPADLVKPVSDAEKKKKKRKWIKTQEICNDSHNENSVNSETKSNSNPVLVVDYSNSKMQASSTKHTKLQWKEFMVTYIIKSNWQDARVFGAEPDTKASNKKHIDSQ